MGLLGGWLVESGEGGFLCWLRVSVLSWRNFIAFGNVGCFNSIGVLVEA